jgi:hypothetical protein
MALIARVDVADVRPGQQVGVDSAGAVTRAPGDLRRAEVAAERPQRPVPVSAGGVGGMTAVVVVGGPSGGPPARNAPGVKPVHDRDDAD